MKTIPYNGTCISPIPVDPYKLHTPQEVVDANVADTIRIMYSEANKPVPKTLDKFLLENQEEGRGRDWETRLMKILCNDESVPVEIMKQWLLCCPSHFFRAEVRAELKQRKTNATPEKKLNTVVAVIITLITSMILLTGCSSQKDSETITRFINAVVTNNTPKKITLTVEVGTWGRKAIWTFEDLKWNGEQKETP